jgi:hypothetical protein
MRRVAGGGRIDTSEARALRQPQARDAFVLLFQRTTTLARRTASSL